MQKSPLNFDRKKFLSSIKESLFSIDFSDGGY
jgi:hypothetical protein